MTIKNVCSIEASGAAQVAAGTDRAKKEIVEEIVVLLQSVVRSANQVIRLGLSPEQLTLLIRDAGLDVTIS